MQKKLLTLAVAGALAAPGLALAQSSVEVYGTINISFGNWRFSSNPSGTQGSMNKWDVAQSASNYGLRGRESLGGGLTAWFQLEENAPLERSNNISITPASRNSAAGVQGAFGNIFLGQWTTPWADLDSLWSIGTIGGWGPVTSIIGRRETTGTAPNPNCVNAVGKSSGVPAANQGGAAALPATCDAVEASGGVGHPFWRRASQSIVYQTPDFAGFQGKLLYQTNESKAQGGLTTGGTTSIAANPSLWSASLQWSGMGGRARIGGAVDRHKDFTTIGNTDTGYALKGGWNFGVADVGLAYERMTYKCGGAGTVAGNFNPGGGTGAASTCLAGEGDVKAKQYGIALAVPVGLGAIRASYSKAKDLESSAAARAKTGAKEWNIGYEHRFSKRTQIGIGYAKIDNDDAGAFTWTGLPPAPNGSNVASPGTGVDIGWIFVSMTHRF